MTENNEKVINDRSKIRNYIKATINPYGKPFEGTAYELGLKIIKYIDGMYSNYEVKKDVPKQYCYSWDGENYSHGLFDSEEEAIAEAKESDLDAQEVYVGIAVTPELRWNSNEEDIIYSMHENLWEDCGEYADDALDITNEQNHDLARMLDETVKKWIEKHRIVPSCYYVIESGLHVFEKSEE